MVEDVWLGRWKDHAEAASPFHGQSWFGLKRGLLSSLCSRMGGTTLTVGSASKGLGPCSKSGSAVWLPRVNRIRSDKDLAMPTALGLRLWLRSLSNGSWLELLPRSRRTVGGGGSVSNILGMATALKAFGKREFYVASTDSSTDGTAFSLGLYFLPPTLCSRVESEYDLLFASSLLCIGLSSSFQL